MIRIALKMLMGDTSKYIGIILGITFAALIMTQQPSIFVGLMSRTFSFISDVGYPDLWVMDSKVQFVDDIKPLQDTQLLRVRGVEGVRWAVPLYKSMLRVRTHDGNFQNCIVVGLDDATLIGGPGAMIHGKLSDLRQSDAVIVDVNGAEKLLSQKLPDGTSRPLRIGDSLEINDKRAVVVGIARVTRTFQSNPVIYTTYSRATSYAPAERLKLSFILTGLVPGVDPQKVIERIRKATRLAAYTSEDFKVITLRYFMKNTGIPINFGISVLLGFLVGAAVSGQMFYNFTHDNIKQFGALKAMGTSNWVLVKMVLVQAIWVGFIGWGLGVGLGSLFGIAMKGSVLAFKLIWQILALSGAGVFIIISLAAVISLVKVIRLEPAIVFRG